MTMIGDGGRDRARSSLQERELPRQLGVGNMFEPMEDFTEDARVSTVDLGGVAVGAYRYETMVFGGMLDGYCMRYRMDGDAREGHRETVERVRGVEAGFYTTESRED